MMLHDCEEKKTKRIELKKFSEDATEQFVKFLYGFELEQDDLETVKELLYMGGLYDVEDLQKAASGFIVDNLTKENVFDVMEFAKTHNADIVMELCSDFVINRCPEKIVSQREEVLKFPELGLALLNGKIHDICNVRVHKFPLGPAEDLEIYKYEVSKPLVHGLKVTLSPHGPKIVIKGIGLLLMPGSEVEVKVSANYYDEYDKSSENVYTWKKSSMHKKKLSVLPIYFDRSADLDQSQFASCDLLIEIKGNGSGLGTKSSKTVTVHTKDNFADFGKEVKFSRSSCPVAEIYFSK